MDVFAGLWKYYRNFEGVFQKEKCASWIWLNLSSFKASVAVPQINSIVFNNYLFPCGLNNDKT